ncbi:MAG: tetratricopeptide repeat protein [Verrucomicrobia bacterium]|nr:tetratricopeptide repeat protein [Verrucomicrobiota bacterium]
MADLTIPETFQLALQHHQAGHLSDAEALYREILARDPGCVEALHHLGVIAHQVGQHAVAAELIGRAAALAPGSSAIHSDLGEAYRHLGRLDEAIASFRRALVVQPGFHGALHNLANALAAQGRLDEALAAGRQALALQPNFASTHNTLGSILRETGRRDEARVSFQRAIALQPDFADAHNNLGIVFQDLGQPDVAVACFRRALALRPDYAATHSNLILFMQYNSASESGEIEANLRRWTEQHAQPLAKFTAPHTNDRSPDRPLRIGYVSPDFRLHSVAFFLLPLLEAHEHTQMHVTGYSTNERPPDHVTARFQACTDDWRSLADLSDEAAVQRIREDRIDVLVDLSGHTAGNRLLVFARKPAPIQVSYLGYPGSTGLGTMDYRITDAWSDPPGATAGYYSEELVRLPDTAWCFAPLSGSPPVSELPVLSQGHVTFGCFNNFAKVTDDILQLWARILHRVPDSHLALKNQAVSTPSVVQQLRGFFGDCGISADRLELVPHQEKALAHLQCHDHVDLVLDTFPYHGTTTTCEALWMGVPVLTLAGSRHVSRVGVSLLTNVGATEFVAHSPDAYVEAAVAATRDLPRLADLRASLRERMQRSPLMAAPRFARAIEAAYRTMWRRWCGPVGVRRGPRP